MNICKSENKLGLKILHLGTPTPSDPLYYSRWRRCGEVLAPEDIKSVFPLDINCLVVDHRITVDDKMLGCYPNLKYIVSPNTAHTHITGDTAKRGIIVLSLKGETQFLCGVRSVAEMTFGLILRLLRPLDGYGLTLQGKTIGVIGHGRIGRQVSNIAKAFLMNVMPIDVNSRVEDWTTVFRHSDIITVHLPEDITTKGIIGDRFLSLMPRHAILINTSRPSIIKHETLFAMIDSRRLLGCALDTWEGTDPPNHPNIILSHHVAGSTVEDRIKTDEFMTHKLWTYTQAKILIPAGTNLNS